MWLAFTLFGLSFLLVVFGVEVLLRHWASRPFFSSEPVAGFSKHGADGQGSWLLPADVVAARDPGFSQVQWTELTAWRTRTYEKPANERWTPFDGGPQLNRLSAVDFQGTEFSIRNRERTTTGQPIHFTNDVLCYGGSTTFCMEVADSQTWCSVVQRKLVERGHNHYRVRNLGIPGTPGLERIMTCRLTAQPQRGDILVFFFGDNDSGWKQYGKRTGRIHTHLPSYLRLLLRLSNRSELAGWIYGELSPRHLPRLAVEMAETTIEAAEDIDRFAKSVGANVLFVLQPNIYTLTKPDFWDHKIMDATASDHRLVLDSAYGRFMEWISHSDIAVSAIRLFCEESPSPYMGDALHVNSRGNELIGDFVFTELESRNLLVRKEDCNHL